MYGLKTVGAITQGFAIVGMVLGIGAGILGLFSPRIVGEAIQFILISIAGGLLGLLIGGAAQALADLTANSAEQRRMLQELTRRRAETQTRERVLDRMKRGE